jgi:hypothetical protein
MVPTHAKIIDAAHAGQTGRLVFAFGSADRNDRTDQINNTMRRLKLQGLAIRVLGALMLRPKRSFLVFSSL